MKLNCGDTCPRSGRYNVIDGNGKVVNSVYVNEGETMPPTQQSDCHYESQSYNLFNSVAHGFMQSRAPLLYYYNKHIQLL